MPRKPISSENDWKPRVKARKMWGRVHTFERTVEKPAQRVLMLLWAMERRSQQGIPAAPNVEKEWTPRIPRSEQAAMARCRVIAISGAEAECAVFVDGFELPRVSFPAWVLRQKGLRVGGRFIWIMRDDSIIRPGDIDPDVRQSDEMTTAERSELDRLYAEFQRGLQEDGGNWPVYTGPGE
jgi:hypothetical protein